jgi:hypothetical protein
MIVGGLPIAGDPARLVHQSKFASVVAGLN